MNKIMIPIALGALATAAPALAQRMGGPAVGTTRDQAMATAATAFAAMDTNHDGTLDKAEVTAFVQARATKNGREFRPQAVDRMMGRFDGNGDGKVTLDEYKAGAGAQFDQVDMNKNGKIDADEVGSMGGGEG